MNVQLLFIAVVMVSCPLIWKVSYTARQWIMMGATVGAFGYMAPFSVSLLILIAAAQWYLWKRPVPGYRNACLYISILLPLLTLVVYKAGHKEEGWIIPLGLSYYTFRQMHAAFERFKGELPEITLEGYLQYNLFLPVLLVGPINRIQDFQRSVRRQKWQPGYFSEGLERILYGLVKVTFLGNYFFSYKFAQWANVPHFPSLGIYLKLVAFTGNAYVQFSGFSDMAIGMGLLWGIKVMENFNYPFSATNMQEFWTRWHISLSSWCRDYIFQPILAYSRNRWLALVGAMLVLAMWHEISWRYLSWGAFHAVMILLTVWSRKKFPAFSVWMNEGRVGKWIGRIWVFHVFSFSCLFIMSDTVNDLCRMLKALFRNV